MILFCIVLCILIIVIRNNYKNTLEKIHSIISSNDEETTERIKRMLGKTGDKQNDSFE